MRSKQATKLTLKSSKKTYKTSINNPWGHFRFKYSQQLSSLHFILFRTSTSVNATFNVQAINDQKATTRTTTTTEKTKQKNEKGCT